MTTKQKAIAAYSRRRKRGRAPRSEAAAGKGYPGVRGQHDSYGNPIRKSDTVEEGYRYPSGAKNRWVMQGKYPRRRRRSNQPRDLSPR